MKNNNLSLTRLWTTTVLILMLSACVNTDGIIGSSNQLDITAAPTHDAEYYQLNGINLDEKSKTDWQIMELKAHVVAENYNSANALINTLNGKILTNSQMAEMLMANAKVTQKTTTNNSAQAALKRLNFASTWQLSDNQWLNYHLYRAELFADYNDYFNSSRSLIEAKQYQETAQYTQANEHIWNNLKQYSPNQLFQLSTTAQETELRGWVELAKLVNANSTSPVDAQTAVQQWFKANSSHSVVTYTPESIEALLSLKVTLPTNIAILLPQSGKFAKPANIILEGFMRASMNARSSGNNQVQSRLYDTSSIDMASLYQQLQAAGTDFIVGPLIKDNVEALQSLNSDIDMLALNVPDDKPRGSKLCYVSLSPEQEAVQAAKHLIEQGYQYPLVLYPNNSRGKRINQAFVDTWHQNTNTPAASGVYGDRDTIQNDLRQAFKYPEGASNVKLMQRPRGLRGSFARQRHLDAIYIVGTRSQVSTVKTYIPVSMNAGVALPKLFATSMSNNGRPMKFHDLAGIKYTDIPMITNEDNSDNDADQYDYNNDAKRLYALGMDSYSLSQNLSVMKVFSGYSITGKSGVLSADANCVILRELSWTEHEGASTEIDDEEMDDEEMDDEETDKATSEES